VGVDELNRVLGERVLIYEGSKKLIYAGPDSSTLILHFLKNDENDVWRNKISESVWHYLKSVGIENHFLRTLNIREQLVMSVNVCPVFLRIHNVAQEDLMNRLGVEIGTTFANPLIEWHLKSKYLKDPLVSRDHIEYFNWLSEDEVNAIHRLAIRTNDVLMALFYYAGMKPSVLELHFGVKDGKIILVGELSPETILFWEESEYKTISNAEVYNKLKALPLHFARSPHYY
jgi:phosphoribosylaminoimidazole-succinocarboxamide synthase